MQEQDPKLQMIDALLASPHRRLVEFGRRHVEARESDLDFYGRLGAWYHDPLRRPGLGLRIHLRWPRSSTS